MKKRECVVQDVLSKVYQDHYTDGKLPTQRSSADQYEVSWYIISEKMIKIAFFCLRLHFDVVNCL